MIRKNLYICCVTILSAVVLYSCKNSKADEKNNPFPARDYSINKATAYNQRFLDSAAVELFIKTEKPDSVTANNLRAFYNSRNYQYAWFDENSLNEQGISFWNLVSSYIHLSKDSSLFNRKLDERISEYIADSVIHADPKILAQTDLALTRQFFVYAQTAYAGKLEPSDLQWFIPRKKIDALALLDSLIARKGSNIEVWEPVNPLFQSLRKKLVQYNEIADKGGWKPISILKARPFKPGDSSVVIRQLKQRLAVSGDYAASDTSNRYDSSLFESVKKVEASLGLKPDGMIDSILIKELNVPVKARIEQMLVNLERMRWLPEQPSPDRIVANIPEFVIHVFENNKNVFDMDIVVGKEGTGTVIFNDKLKYIVFSPYWNVPRSIVKNEIAPAMARNSSYLASHNMEVTGTAGGLPVIRQLPGGSNSLGRVKFLFPNNYNIYFHDTPAKSLFSKEKRAFSHGCIRLADAEKMANYLLRKDSDWSPEKIKEAMSLTKEKWVTLKNEIPVFISYFTAWVDGNGTLNFRDDIYGHDKRMAEHLFTQPALSSDGARILQQ
jgi:murein L,D-transpeptidase YcbB/YkuD